MRPIRPLRRDSPGAGAARGVATSALLKDRPARAPERPARPIARRKEAARQTGESAPARVLHAGCGLNSPARLHGLFRGPDWQEIRLDIDAAARPDITASVIDMRAFVEDESCDAIWCSHILEHLSRHEVARALGEFHRVLIPFGFALIRCPDLETVAELIVAGRIDDVVYTSPAGPIAPLDMLYGHGASIANGNGYMRHGTGFTQDLLARDFLGAGFAEVRTMRTQTYEIWAAAFMPAADAAAILGRLAEHGLNLRD